MNAKRELFSKKVAINIFTGNQSGTCKWILASLFIGEMQTAPKEYHNPVLSSAG
jgi:hypothetical protein